MSIARYLPQCCRASLNGLTLGQRCARVCLKGVVMKWHCMIAAAFVWIAAPSQSAVAQATAETALTHALSSATGNSVGNTLGKATGQLAGKLGQQTTNAVPQAQVSQAQAASTSKVKPAQPGTGPASTPSSSSGSLIVAIHGGVSARPPCPAPLATKEGPTAPEKPATNAPAPAPSASACAPAQETSPPSHPNHITLPAAH